MRYKNTPHEIKDYDEEKGIVEAYANVYNVEDSDGDISAIGSFKRTVNNNFKRFRVLKDHNSTISLGVPMEVDAEDEFGLRTVTQFNLQKEVSRDMFSDIKLYMENGLNAELSIGYEVVKRKDKEPKVIEEYKLYEYSFLTGWAANHLSTVEGIKAVKDVQGIIELITKAYDLNYSDTRLKQIEAALKSLDQVDSSDDTPQIDPILKALDQFNTKLTLRTQSWKLQNN